MSLLTLDEAMSLRRGQRLVFTNGVFDVIHAGHVRYLAQARSLGDLLIVGINSDDSVRRLGKGPERPIHTLSLRAEVLTALRCVDGVIAFEETTPIAVIQVLRPEIHVKGGDYRSNELPETSAIEAYGGEVVILPLVEGLSTTATLGKLRTG